MSLSSRVALPGATALVTGATGGLGPSIAGALAGRGARLIVSGRREAELQTVADAVGGRAVVADLAIRHDVDRLATEAADADVLVANAALPASGQLANLTRGEIDRILEVNLRVPIVLAQALIPGMAARGGGQLVFISSLSGKATSPASSMYSATKFGLRGFALALRQDLARQNIGVSVVTPGFIRDAGMYHDVGARLPFGVGTRTARDVARAVIRAIEEDRAELDVASPQLRVGVAVASLVPGLAERASRRLGSQRIASQFAARQIDKR
jgi:short-subunit dehydrogenase